MVELLRQRASGGRSAVLEVAVGDAAVVHAVAAMQHRLAGAEEIIGKADAGAEVVLVAGVVVDAVEGGVAGGRAVRALKTLGMPS